MNFLLLISLNNLLLFKFKRFKFCLNSFQSNLFLNYQLFYIIEEAWCMKAKSRLIEQAGTALLPFYLRREGIKAYQCPEMPMILLYQYKVDLLELN
jgi:hypothetical protein